MKKNYLKIDYWRWFGFLSAFTFCIWISIVVFQFLQNKKSPEIIVKGRVGEYVLPPVQGSAPTVQMPERTLIDSIQRILRVKDLKDSKVRGVIDFMNSQKTEQPDDNPLSEFVSLWVFEVENKSKNTLNDAYLELPEKGKFLIETRGKNSVYDDFNRKIPIGEVEPSFPVYIFAWSEDAPENFDRFDHQGFRLVYANGSKQVSFPEVLEIGFLIKFFHSPMYIIIAMGVFLVIIAAIIIISYNLGVSSCSEAEEQKQPVKETD